VHSRFFILVARRRRKRGYDVASFLAVSFLASQFAVARSAYKVTNQQPQPQQQKQEQQRELGTY